MATTVAFHLSHALKPFSCVCGSFDQCIYCYLPWGRRHLIFLCILVTFFSDFYSHLVFAYFLLFPYLITLQYFSFYYEYMSMLSCYFSVVCAIVSFVRSLCPSIELQWRSSNTVHKWPCYVGRQVLTNSITHETSDMKHHTKFPRFWAILQWIC